MQRCLQENGALKKTHVDSHWGKEVSMWYLYEVRKLLLFQEFENVLTIFSLILDRFTLRTPYKNTRTSIWASRNSLAKFATNVL